MPVATSSLILTTSLTLAFVFNQQASQQQSNLLDPTALNEGEDGLAISAYGNLIKALGFQRQSDLRTFTNAELRLRLQRLNLDPNQISLMINQASSKQQKFSLLLTIKNQDRLTKTPIEIKNFDWTFSRPSGRIITFNKNNQTSLLRWDTNMWFQQKLPLKLNQWSSNQITSLTNIDSQVVKNLITDFNAVLNQPIANQIEINHHDRLFQNLSVNFQRRAHNKVDLVFKLNEPSWKRIEIEWKDNQWQTVETNLLETELAYDQQIGILGGRWDQGLTFGEVLRYINSDLLYRQKNVPLTISAPALKAQLINDYQATSAWFLKTSFDFQIDQSTFQKILDTNLPIVWKIIGFPKPGFNSGTYDLEFGLFVDQQLIKTFKTFPSLEFKTYRDDLHQLVATLEPTNLAKTALLNQILNHQPTQALIKKWQDNPHKNPIQNQVVAISGQTLVNQLFNQSDFTNELMLNKFNANFKLEFNHGTWMQSDQVDWTNQLWSVRDVLTNQATVVETDLFNISPLVEGFNIIINSTFDPDNKPILTITNENLQWSALATRYYTSITTKLKISYHSDEIKVV